MKRLVVSGALMAAVMLSGCYGNGRDRPGRWGDHHGHGGHHGSHDHDHDRGDRDGHHWR